MNNARPWFLRAGCRFSTALIITFLALIFAKPSLGGDRDTDQPTLEEGTAEVHQGATEATIEWRTATPSSSQVFFGSSEALEKKSELDEKLVTDHRVVISGLKPAMVYHFKPVSKNGSGLVVSSSVGSFATNHSGMPWGVSISSPANGAQVSGSVALQATGYDKLTSVQFIVDGKAVGSPLTAAPYHLMLNTANYANGPHILLAKGQSSNGLQLISWPIWIRIRNGRPSDLSVAITAPSNGATVSGMTTVQSNATDADSVQFTLDGNPIGAPITVAPFAYSWNTQGAANGNHTLAALASSGGNVASSQPVKVNVENASSSPPPTIAISTPANGSSVNGTIAINTTVSSSVSSVQFQLDGKSLGAADSNSPFTYSWNTTTASNGIHTVSAVAQTQDGRTANSQSVQVKVNNTSTTPPPPATTISITSPKSGATVSGNVSITTSVSSNVSSVQFQLDGSSLGSLDTSSPFSFSWNTSGTSNGKHMLTAVATSSSNQTVSSVAVSVTVSNATTPPPSGPSVSLTSPSNGSTVSGSVTVTATATDTGGSISNVQFLLNGQDLGIPVTSSPYSTTWNTASVSDGSYTLSAVATDSNGKTATATDNVTVSNSSSGGNGGGSGGAPQPNATDQVTLTDTSGSTQTNRVVSIGRPFVQGEIPNFAQASINGNAVLTQCDVKNRWSDGSLKFAVVSFVVPSIPANGSVTVSFGNQSSGNNTNFLASSAMLAAQYNFDGQIQVKGSQQHNISARAMLTSAGSCGDPGSDPDGGKFICSYWLKGPIVTAVVLEDRTSARSFDVSADGAAGNPLHPIFEAWFYPQGNAVQLGYSLENDWASTNATNSMRDQTYSLVLTGGQNSPATEYSNGSFNHMTRTRWHKTFWVNGAPGSVHVDNNYGYLAQTKAYPHWDPSLQIASSKVSSEISGFASSPQTIQGTSSGVGDFQEALNATGAAEWHGPLTTWDIIYLLTQNDDMKDVMLGNADLGGRIPYFYREADTSAGHGQFFDNAGTVGTMGRVVSINARTQVTLQDVTEMDCPTNYAPDTINIGGSGQDTDGWDLDSSHWPNLSFASYLTTGQYAYYEEQLMQSAYAIGFNNGCVSSGVNYIRQGSAGYWYWSQERGTDWAARENAIGAFVAVDGSPEQAYFQDKLWNNIAVWEGMHSIPNDTPGSRTSAWTFGNTVRVQANGASPLGVMHDGLSEYVQNGPMIQSGSGAPSSADANFQAAYSVYILGFINDLGFNTTKLLQFGEKRYIHLTEDPAANVYNMADYVFPTLDQSGNWITSWAQSKTFYASQPTAWPACGNITLDESYGHEGLAALSFGAAANMTDGGFSASAGYTKVRNSIGCLTGTNSFQDSSPKWDITPRTGSSSSGGSGSGGSGSDAPPSVAITAPAVNAVVSNAVMVKANASAPSGTQISSVQFLVNGTNLGSADTASPYTMSWNTSAVPNGTYQIAAVATDSTGTTAASTPVAVTVNNGSVTNPLTVAITAPSNGATVSGSVTMTATATDSNAVTGIQFAVDGANVGSVITSPPYTTTWNASGAAAGGHTIKATATDSAANTASASITVTIASSTPPPPPPPPPAGSGWTKLHGTTLKGGSENASPCPPDGFDGYNPLPGGFATQCQYVIESWNSAIPDPARNRLIIWGGGHDDYGGNEFYSLELGQSPPTLIRLNPPSPPNTQSGVCVETLSDGRPNSRHTYDSLVYLPNQDEMLAFGGALNDCGNPGNGTWTVTLSSILSSCAPNCSSNWSKHSTNTVPDAQVGVTSDYDPNTGLAWEVTQNNMFTFDPTTNQYTHQANISVGYHGTGIIDPVDHYFIHADSNTGIHYWSIASGSSFTENTASSSSCAGLLNTTYNGNSGYPGLAWDPIDQVVVGYPNGGNVLYILNPKTWTCTTESYGSSQGTDYPQNDAATASSGTFKHFNYVSSLDEFVLCNDPYNDCWVLHRPRN